MSNVTDTSQVTDVNWTEHSLTTSAPSQDDATTSHEYLTTLTETSITDLKDNPTGKAFLLKLSTF